MNRKMIIILAVQSAAILLLLGFGFIQKAEADKQREIAEEAVMVAEHERLASMDARAEAEMQRRLAEENAAMAQRQLEECESAGR